MKIKNNKREDSSNITYTVLTTVYNVEKYLNDFFSSIVSQTLKFDDHIFLLIVDDGSQDNSAKIIKEWQKKYPSNIKYIKKENGGQSSAFNLGLKYVNTPWVTFIDPDDFISKAYFEEVNRYISHDIDMISCRLLFYFEDTQEVKNHYLNYRFKKRKTIVNPLDMQGNIQSTITSIFVKHKLISDRNLLFNESIKPLYYDGHFVNQIFLKYPKLNLVFLNKPIYYYRKRKDNSSLLDSAWTKAERYNEALKFGLLDLFKKAENRQQAIPEYLQRFVLYHLSWYLKRIVFNNFSLEFLSDQQVKGFQNLFEELFKYIDIETIENCGLGAITYKYKLGLLSYYKSTEISYQIYYIDDYNQGTNIITLHYYYIKQDDSIFLLNDSPIELINETLKQHSLFDSVFVNEKKVQLKIKGEWKYLNVKLQDTETFLSINKKRYKHGLQVWKIKKLLILKKVINFLKNIVKKLVSLYNLHIVKSILSKGN